MKKYILLVFSLISLLVLNIYFRSFPINFPQLKVQSRNTVEQKIREKVEEQINKDSPGISALAKKRLINNLISDYKKQKRQEIEEQVYQQYLKLKDKFQNPAGQTYFMELDCWHWARYVDNVLRLGHPGDKVINGKQWDSLMLAPKGSYLLWNQFLFYFPAIFYKFFSLIKPVPLFTFLFYLPLFFIAIFIVVLYLFCFYCTKRNLCPIVTCLFVGLAPTFLTRSCAGWFDMDILSLIFPIIIIWPYLMIYNSSSLRQRLLWLCLSSFFLGLFCFSWIGWWFILLIILMYEIYSLLDLLSARWQYKEKNLTLFKQRLLNLILFLIFSLFWIVVFSGSEPLKFLYLQIKEALVLNKPLAISIWPNVYSTVGELREVNLFQVINLVGGAIIFISSLSYTVTLFLLTRRSKKYTGFAHESIVMLIFWFLSMFFACLRGMRFVMFLIIPVGISLGWLINDVYTYFKNRNKKPGICLVIAIFIILSLVSINKAYKTSVGIFPLMDDAWYKTLVALKETTPKDAVINSWWDFGDWFKMVSMRRVIFDGQSQNTPQAYWMAKILLNNNEEEVMGVLRMLNNGGNRAFEIINEELKDPFKSVLLLEKIISSNKTEEARKLLLQFLPVSVTRDVIKLLFARPAPAYFVVEYTIPNKIYPISSLGNWDFSKVYLAQNINKRGKDEIINYLTKLGEDRQQVERFYKEADLIAKRGLDNWIASPRLKFYSGLAKGQEKDNIIFFDNGLVYAPKEQVIYLSLSGYGRFNIPESLFIFKDDKFEEIIYPNRNLNFSALIFKTQQDYRSILLDRQLADSLFVRLYFLNGSGLKHFKPFIEENNGDNLIRVFEIIWD